MTAHHSQNSSAADSGLNLGLLTILPSFILQIGTVSMLMVLTTQKASQAALMAIGEASEEIFRGERLPLLDFPEADTKK